MNTQTEDKETVWSFLFWLILTLPLDFVLITIILSTL